ncbi:DUF418 domain-containing protein [Nocardiopsis composta]|uniref:Putative membrane protein YeiB n=1 Tax=Nocardiopsis composta TaxID=157465 RepID=A0A7W8QIY5_9ACTN|nr:DUF418 domain-containing protein [Nocardiopsis composta]MBB5431104.1 putative membrane protein YeiB [Nocardiopsis composta]
MTTPTRGPAARALAPDLARGAMLLAIACAHAPLFVVAVDHGPRLANDIALVVHQIFVGNHARPMFAFLFGYALVQMLDRRTERGADWPEVRRLLRRRGWWLVAFGALHTALVPLDILAVYGITSVLLVGLLRVRNRTLLWVAGAALVPATLSAGIGMWQALSQGVTTFDTGSVAGAAAPLFPERLQVWLFSLFFAGAAVAPPMIIGIWAARRRLLDEPERHRALLLRAAVLTTAVSVLGAAPAILIQLGAWTDPPAAAVWAASLAQPLTGYFGGIGMAAIIALAAIGAARRRGPLTTAVEALGQRSMSLYLFQTFAFLAVFRPYGLGLQDDLGLAGAFGVAGAIWLVSLPAADLMRRAGRRGPAEALLRRLAYPAPAGRASASPLPR